MSLAGRARAEPCRDVDGIASSRILPRSVVSCKSKTTHQVPVVQTSDSTIHQIKHHSRVVEIDFRILIRWIVIYPVGSAIQRLNIRGQGFH